MATLTIRDLDEPLKAKLRVRAAGNGRSVEAEARDILRLALDEKPPVTRLGTRIGQRFAAMGGVRLQLPDRAATLRSPDPR
jgi:plasmid stability protein